MLVDFICTLNIKELFHLKNCNVAFKECHFRRSYRSTGARNDMLLLTLQNETALDAPPQKKIKKLFDFHSCC